MVCGWLRGWIERGSIAQVLDEFAQGVGIALGDDVYDLDGVCGSFEEEFVDGSPDGAWAGCFVGGREGVYLFFDFDEECFSAISIGGGMPIRFIFSFGLVFFMFVFGHGVEGK